MNENGEIRREVRVGVDGTEIAADLALPPRPGGLVVFAHGSGSSRHSPRNRQVADRLVEEGLGTLLMDLLTEPEEEEERFTRHHRFDIPLLGRRLVAATNWLETQEETSSLPVGYFGASTGAAAALVAAADLPGRIGAVVSRGGRPDLADGALPQVEAPTLLIVGGADHPVIELNEQAAAAMRAETRIEIIPGATHLFPEPNALERVADLAADWFTRHLAA